MMSFDANRLRVGLYVGEGASHSWTWFVDLMEKAGVRNLSFLREQDFAGKAPEQDLLLVSGGDTFAMAGALRPSGPAAIRAFLDRGGLYVGSCAGAYLPLHSSKEPLCDFNFVKSKISNLVRDLPPAHRLPAKFCNRYGCNYVVHPVREDVRVRMADGFPVWGGREILVPLYGGPPLQESEDIRPQATYTGFTERTLFLTDRETAEQVYLGKVAACEKRIGRGRMVLLGPHFEHPWFPEGNGVILQWIRACARPAHREADARDVRAEPGEPAPRKEAAWLRSLKSEVSNMRIRADALARQSVHWRIGDKTYEPEKIVPFLDAVWKRLSRIPARSRIVTHGDEAETVMERAGACHAQIREMAERMRTGEESGDLAAVLFPSLKDFAVRFLEIYFRQGFRVPLPGGRRPLGGRRT
jgi:hypothetical protein